MIMSGGEVISKEPRANVITAISAAVLAIIGFIGLILAMTEFIEVRNKILGFEGAALIIIIIIAGIFIIIWILTRWIKNG